MTARSKQLNYFEIEGVFGGNQDWFTNIIMHMGGCAAATACDCCIYLAREKGLEKLYPFDAWKLTKKDYKSFSMSMKPYLKPRSGGIDKLEIFIDGFQNYITDIGEHSEMESFSGEESFESAKGFVIRKIEEGFPIPYLLLRHVDKQTFKDFIWHWFLLVGYEEQENDLIVTTATYGEAMKFSLKTMWETGNSKKGGMVGTEFF